MNRYKMTIAYEGTHYGGWQVQPSALTIQALIQDALATILPEPTHLSASGRTDAGVHALEQVAHFNAPDIDPFKTLRSLNGLLPKDIRITSLEPINSSFHARFSATAKTYHYNLSLGHTPDPFMRNFSHHLYTDLDIPRLQANLSHFLGTHDFTSFANESSKGAAGKNPVRTLTTCQATPTPFGLQIEITGNGFLYKMVRNIVGALIKPCDIPALLKAKDRRLAPPAAPAKGLFLTKVYY